MQDRRSVLLSVRLSHAGVDSKLMTVGSSSFHHRVAQWLYFWDQISYPRLPVNTLGQGFKWDWVGWVKTAKKRMFSTSKNENLNFTNLKAVVGSS